MSLNRRPTGASSYTSPGPAPLAFSNSHPEQLNARQLRERSERFYKEFATTLGDEVLFYFFNFICVYIYIYAFLKFFMIIYSSLPDFGFYEPYYLIPARVLLNTSRRAKH